MRQAMSQAAPRRRLYAVLAAVLNLMILGGMKLEAASGFEPESRGFADLRLNHLATPPRFRL